MLGSQRAICPSNIVPVEQSCVGWGGDEKRSSSSSSILELTAANSSIALRTPGLWRQMKEERREASRSCKVMVPSLMSGWGPQYEVTERLPLPSLRHSGEAHPKSRSYCCERRDDISLWRQNIRFLWMLGDVVSGRAPVGVIRRWGGADLLVDEGVEADVRAPTEAAPAHRAVVLPQEIVHLPCEGDEEIV
ncbi:hypothetical protein EYF80_005930 [Liparis tanakae]|uniref:Uncharacterized protein n=1 Tax=Liparis tanakae TaxID=230148 RepID=A0A4Z2J1Q9_9TELE|nr:hypothetical protein EYF80_005930 [Liparis tanakae]